MKEITIKIKPMSVNKAWRGGRRFRTKEYNDYIENCLLLLPRKKTVEEKVKICFEFHIKNPRQVDLDNFLKPLLDILQKAELIKDDRQVYAIEAKKILSDEEKIVIEIIKIADRKIYNKGKV